MRATSLAVEVYRRMPNSTDLTVFLEAGIPGLNFAFISGVARGPQMNDNGWSSVRAGSTGLR